MKGNYETSDRGFRIRQVAERLAVSIDSVKRLIREERIRSIRIGGSVVIPGAEVDRVLREGCPLKRSRKVAR
jgi:excisionase family DNA binding protein